MPGCSKRLSAESLAIRNCLRGWKNVRSNRCVKIVSCSPGRLRNPLSSKRRVVSADEKEGGLRRVLNFGHTLGHALETATQYRHFLHGEAVAWGMIAAAKIADEMRYSNNGTFDRVRDASLAWGSLPNVTLTTSKAMSLIRSDKKTESGVVNFVLPKEIGKVEVVNRVPESCDSVLAG